MERKTVKATAASCGSPLPTSWPVIGAVYGQIAGAYYGLSAIPAEWKEAVKDWKKVDDFIVDFLHAAKCM